MKRKFNFIPTPLKRLDHYLLTHHPNLWRTRLHYIVCICLVASVLLFILGWNQVENPEFYLVDEHYFYDVIGKHTFPLVLVSVLGIIYWRRKLTEFLLKNPNIRQGGLVILSYFVGLLLIYFAAISFSIGAISHIQKESIRPMVPDTAFLTAKENFLLGDMLSYVDSSLLKNPRPHFDMSLSWGRRLKNVESSNLSGFDYSVNPEGIRIYPYLHLQDKNYNPSWPKTYLQPGNKKYLFTKDSFPFYLKNISSLIEKLDVYAIAISPEKWETRSTADFPEWDPDYGNFIALEAATTVLNLSESEQTLLRQISGNILYLYQDIIQQMDIENARPWLEWLEQREKIVYNVITSETLHYKLEFYQLVKNFLQSLDAEEQALYRAYQKQVLIELVEEFTSSFFTFSNLVSLRALEIRRYFHKYPNKKELGFLDEASIERYKEMCYFYALEESKPPDYLSLNKTHDIDKIQSWVDTFLIKETNKTAFDQLYYYTSAQEGLPPNFTRLIAPSTYHDIWIGHLYDYYHSKYDESDFQRLANIYQNISFQSIRSYPAGNSLYADWLDDSARGLPLDSMSYKRVFLDKLKLEDIDNKLSELTENKKRLLSISIFSHGWKGLLDLIFIVFILFFLSIHSTRIILNSIITVALIFVIVTFLQQQLDAYEAFLYLMVHLFGFVLSAYLMIVPPYRSRILDHVLCSFVIYGAVVPLTYVENVQLFGMIINPENGVFLSLLMYVVLYTLYFRHQQLPMKS